jgi:broad specificity phosphatase PhoE
MRHAEPNWALVEGDAWRGAANDLAPLTELGEMQATAAAEVLRRDPPDLVLSSPMTRALHTAAIIANALDLQLRVDLDLREWLPDESYQWTSAGQVQQAYESMIEHRGIRTGDGDLWESLASVRSRAWEALRPHEAPGRSLLVVCHEVLIHALTGHPRTQYTEVRVLTTPTTS